MGMTVDETRSVLETYLESGHGAEAIADDAVFTVMATGQEAKGRAEIGELLRYFYHQAFEARAEATNLVVGEGKAVFEGDFTGRHIGEFAGLPASGREVHVPLCVSYDLEGGRIVRARIYFEMDALRAQVSAVAL
jgi:steroid delta-isomerase-like uncharacterized protein